MMDVAVSALDLLRAKTHEDFSNIPEWAIEAHREGILEIYSMTIGVVTPNGDEIEGDIWDWVIRGDNGELDVRRERYVKIPDPNAGRTPNVDDPKTTEPQR